MPETPTSGDASTARLTISAEKLAAFRSEYFEDRPFARRVSTLLIAQMFVSSCFRIHNIFQILDAIRELEGEGIRTGTKPSGRYRKLPLRGLWHKHFSSSRYMFRNLILEMQRPSFLDDLTGILEPGKKQELTPELIGKVAHLASFGVYERRFRESRVTGEWIVFVKRPDGNRYLTLASHKEGDAAILKRILENCTVDFPDLSHWIAHARHSSHSASRQAEASLDRPRPSTGSG